MKKSLDPREAFIEAWQASASIDDAMQKLGWTGTRRALVVRASKLRRKGVPLKRFKNAPLDTPQIVSAKAQFISVWQTSGTISEVAERLGIPYGTAITKANRLRKEGVYLKRHLPRRTLHK